MYKKSFFIKASMIFAIVAIVIVTGVLTGCQKEIKEEVTCKRVNIKDYQPVRLKSGGENYSTVNSFSISSTNTTGYVILDPGKTYYIEFQSASSGFYSDVEMKWWDGASTQTQQAGPNSTNKYLDGYEFSNTGTVPLK